MPSQVEEARQREKHEMERARHISEARQAERKAERVLGGQAGGEQAARWQTSLDDDQREEQERAHRADRLRAQRKQVRHPRSPGRHQPPMPGPGHVAG